MENFELQSNYFEKVTKKIAPISLALGAALTGCGGSVHNDYVTACETCTCPEGGGDSGILDGNIDSGAPEGGKDSEIKDSSPESAVDLNKKITRRELVIALKENVMRMSEVKQPCVSKYPDINKNDVQLCDAVRVLELRGAIKGYTDGEFKPEHHVMRSEAWKAFALGLGFSIYDSSCLYSAGDADPEAWYNAYAGALCLKNIGITKSDGKMHTIDDMTLGELETLDSEASSYLNLDSINRITTAEVIYEVLYEKPQIPEILNCVSPYADLPDDSLECHIVTELQNAGLLDVKLDNFQPYVLVNWPEAGKLLVTGSNGFLTANECNDCSGADQAAWYCPHLSSLCNSGYIGKDAMSGGNVFKTPSRFDVYNIAWHIQMDREDLK